jgi:hypothetical protein
MSEGRVPSRARPHSRELEASMSLLLLLHVLGSVLVAFLGRHRRIGFWGFLLVSLLITPFITLLILLMSADSRVRKPAS